MASMDIDPPESTVPSATASTSALTSQAESDAGPSSQLCLRDKLLFAQAVHKVGAGKEKWPAVRNLMEGNEMVEMKKGILEEEVGEGDLPCRRCLFPLGDIRPSTDSCQCQYSCTDL